MNTDIKTKFRPNRDDQCDVCHWEKIVLIPMTYYSITGQVTGHGKICIECIKGKTFFDSSPTKMYKVKKE